MTLWNAEGTFRLVASEAIGLGVDVEGAADGKVAATGGAGVDLPLTNDGDAVTTDGQEVHCVRKLV